MTNVLNKAKDLWNKDQLRVYVMVSLAMQMSLIIFAPFRKRNGNKMLIFSLWAMYLGADYIATMGISSILTYMKGTAASTGHILPALWAPFLLLHLGGPDSITSYSIEDNALWLRHLLSVFVQVPMAFMVLVQSTLQSTKLLVPSLLIFLVGTIKYGERTLALRGATEKQIKRLDKHQDDLIAQEYMRKKTSKVSDAELIYEGYISFRCLTPWLVNNIVRSGRFLDWGGRDFKVMGITLSFYYDTLHTKAKFVHSFWGCGVRLASLVSTSIALFLFHISKKQGHDNADVIIAYILLLVALFLDIYSLLLSVTSKWMISYLMRRGATWSKKLAEFICRVSCSSNKQWWSGRMGQHSLLQSAVKSRVEEEGHIILRPFKKGWDLLFRGKQTVKASEVLEDMMMEHVKSLAQEVIIENPRSSWISRTIGNYVLYFSESKSYLEDLSFEECVIVWHVVTELWHIASNDANNGDTKQGRSNTISRDIEQDRSNTNDGHIKQGRSNDIDDIIEQDSNDSDVIVEEDRNDTDTNGITEEDRNHIDNYDSKEVRTAIFRISNYMMHLLVKQSEMMPAGIAEVRVLELVDQVSESSVDFFKNLPKDTSRENMHVLKCFAEHLSKELTTRVVPIIGILQAIFTDLHNIGNSSQCWEVMRDVWMEMLTYAALGCNTRQHAKSLSRGGELLTHHWILSVHYNLATEHTPWRRR